MSIANGMYLALLTEALSMSSHEVRILELLKEHDHLATGEISSLVSLSPGGTTAVLDRLSQMSWIHRHSDPLDRRRVCVQLMPERKAELSLIREQLIEKLLSTQPHLSQVLNGHCPTWIHKLQKQTLPI